MEIGRVSLFICDYNFVYIDIYIFFIFRVIPSYRNLSKRRFILYFAKKYEIFNSITLSLDPTESSYKISNISNKVYIRYLEKKLHSMREFIFFLTMDRLIR